MNVTDLDGAKPNLAGQSLCGADLTGLDLREANLPGPICAVLACPARCWWARPR